MSTRGSDHRPAVIKCPSGRQLMPSQTVDPLDLDTEPSLRLPFVPRPGFRAKKDFLWTGSAPSLCGGRRAMVNKIWFRDVSRAWLRSSPERPHARLFSEPRCRNYLPIWYLVWRCLVLCAWLGIIVCSMLEIGSSAPAGNNHKWPIYLTNWDLLLGTIQASFALALVYDRWKLQKSGSDPAVMTIGKMEKIYWFLYGSTCTIAIGVTVSYWGMVYDPKIHQVDPLNVMLHVCNSVLMIFDICLTNVPIRLRHFWWPLTIVVPYVAFSLVYYAAGGLDKKGCWYIYKVLDWEKPVRTTAVCLGGMIFLIIVHCLLCLVQTLRERLHAQTNEKYSLDAPSNPTSEQPSPRDVKGLEIV